MILNSMLLHSPAFLFGTSALLLVLYGAVRAIQAIARSGRQRHGDRYAGRL